MKAFAPLLLLACLIAPVPALAQPVDITVYGGQRDYDTRPDAYPNVYDYHLYDSGTTTNFDPAGAALNAAAIAFPKRRPHINVDRMITLNATGDSMLAHQLKCQAAYSTYELVSDTYLDRRGLPRPCRL